MLNIKGSSGFVLTRILCCCIGTATATLGVIAAAALAVEPVSEATEPNVSVTIAETTTESVETESVEAVSLVGSVRQLELSQLELSQLELSQLELNPSEEAVAPSAVVPSLVASPTLAQVTSVSELSDVSPGDWAYSALQRLVEEYGCLEGYPDSTFLGNRAMSRYEFAAGLNACLDVVLALLPIDGNSEIDSLRRLQEEFAAELAVVRSQIDTLETDVAELRANQFSTTTKLTGQVFSHLNYATASGDIQAEGTSPFVGGRDAAGAPIVRTITEDPAVTFTYLAWLNLTTSFTGQDRLQLQLAVGDGASPANTFVSAGLFNTYGTPFTLSRVRQDDEPVIRELFYSFPVGDQLSITIGPRINWYRHFDNNRFTFLVTGANSFNSSGGTQVNAVDRGAGIVAQWDIADWIDLRLGYLAENTEFLPGPRSSSDPTRGLFGGANTLTGQVGIYPSDNLNLRFLYTRSNLEPNAAGFIGGAVSEPLYGLADDGFGGPLGIATADTFLFNFDWLVTQGFGLFGRYSYGSTHLFPTTVGRANGSVNAQSIQIGTAFPDLFKPGALATISYLQPFELLDGRNFLVSGGGNGGIQKEIEASYRYPVSPNFAIVPSIYWIMEANNFSNNPDIFVFNLQTQFSF
ncbi:MAG: iron uptake porin [Phormidesmis sp. RL_2_1]|nr:iron uptake porin [Phormidesmis sp. RL_2_1]